MRKRSIPGRLSPPTRPGYEASCSHVVSIAIAALHTILRSYRHEGRGSGPFIRTGRRPQIVTALLGALNELSAAFGFLTMVTVAISVVRVVYTADSRTERLRALLTASSNHHRLLRTLTVLSRRSRYLRACHV